MSDMNDCLNRSKNRDKACSHLSGKFPELQVRETRVSFSVRDAVRRLTPSTTQQRKRRDEERKESSTFAPRDGGWPRGSEIRAQFFTRQSRDPLELQDAIHVPRKTRLTPLVDSLRSDAQCAR